MWKFRLYQDMRGEWRWRLLAKNGKIVADSAEGYASEASVTRAVRRFMKQITVVQRFLVEV